MNDSITCQSEYGPVRIDLLGAQVMGSILFQEIINKIRNNIRNNMGVPESLFRSGSSQNKIEEVDWMKEGF